MSSVAQVNGWFLIDGKEYGPATVHLTQEATSEGRTVRFAFHGRFELDETADMLPLSSDISGEILIEDGKRAYIRFTHVQNCVRGKFKVVGDFR